MSDTKICIESYSKLKNLKLVGEETGIAWQQVYRILKRANVPVCGDKARYGSVTDRLAVHAEQMFKKAVPFAVDNNDEQWQSTVDFSVGNETIDIKASIIQDAYRNSKGKSHSARWAYCISKQKDVADHFVLYALEKDKSVRHVFLIPKEIATNSSSISIPESLKSKWADYEVKESELFDFFSLMKKAS